MAHYTFISKRLAFIIPNRETEVKMNGAIYHAGISLGNYYRNELEWDYELDMLLSGEFNYFCYNKANKITCWPTSRGEQPINDHGTWQKEGRQEMKPGRFLLLFANYMRVRNANHDTVYDEQIKTKVIARLCEVFTDMIRGSNEDITFETTSDVLSIYNTPCHKSSGYLQNSCMRHGSTYGCAQYANFYNLIPDLKIAYKKIGDQLLFRALLWSCEDTRGNKITFLDRPYASDAVINQLIDYAKSHGWAWRSFSNNYITQGEDNRGVGLKCKLPDHAFDYLKSEGSPYVDTMSDLKQDSEGWWLSNYMYADYQLTCCDGCAVRKSTVCCCCRNSIHEGDIWTSEDGACWCQSCYDDHFSYCEGCGHWMDRDEVHNVDAQSLCTRCAERAGYVLCYHCDNWTGSPTIIDEDAYCRDCVHTYFVVNII